MAPQGWSWLQIEEMVAPHNWRCLSRDWTLLDWVEKGVEKTRTRPGTAGTQTSSEKTHIEVKQKFKIGEDGFNSKQ